MLRTRYPYYLANEPVFTEPTLDVIDKYDGTVATKVSLAGPEAIEKAISAAVAAEAPMRAMPAWQRKEVLEHVVRRLRERREELALALCIEAGKPIRDARGEVERLIDTFQIAAEESVRIGGEVMTLDIAPRATGYRGFTKQVPIGAVSLITPFNFPLNLVAHKVAPAIAAGCPFVLKPSEKTPVGALILGEILAETSLPKGAFSVLTSTLEHVKPFIEDPRQKLLSFTGSVKVGWELKARAGKKKVVLELGGNAACIVDRDADVERAVERLIFGAFYQTGQSSISVQRILVHASIYDRVRDALVAKIRTLASGDPKNEETFLGPMIDEASARRLESWIASAVRRGARVLVGGRREGVFLDATLLENVPHDEPLCAEEAFGPVAVLERFEDFDRALAGVNDSKFGLQAGLFTNDLAHAFKAWDTLDVGGVVVGDVPSFRVDNMPYGGVKDSGLGREGIRSAIADMTETRLLVLAPGLK
jgi:acyl-CoA reductase-like NAD-dependent aldehyde dehydrogenase